MYETIEADHVQVNSIRVKPSTQSQQMLGIAEKEELSQTDDEQESPEIEIHGEVNVNPITVNRVPIGEACSPYEVIQIQTESVLFPVVNLYNYETGPIVTNAEKGNKKVTISTINSIQAKLRQEYRLKLKDDWPMEEIMIPNMKLRLQPQVIPDHWHDLEEVWADHNTYGVAA